MAREITNALRAQLGQRATSDAWAWLLEVRVPTSPATRYRLCDQKSAIEFGENSSGEPLVYYPAAFEFSGLEERGDGSLPEITVTVGNASLDLRADLETYYGLTDQQAVLRLVNLALTGSTANQVEWVGEVGEPTITTEGISFPISSVNLTDRNFPARRHTARTCKHPKFGAGACPYPVDDAGAAYSTCPRSLEACEARGADMVSLGYEALLPLRFGGELGIGRRQA